eukprot:1342272-Amorphochlora_amoeboformis.AAC.1
MDSVPSSSSGLTAARSWDIFPPRTATQLQFTLDLEVQIGMSDWVDYYGLLGVDFEATSTDIRKAYKRLALVPKAKEFFNKFSLFFFGEAGEWHPDRNGGSDVAVKKFQTLQEIYE